jgi:ubiquinone/menaquinone biosynthesis C-methylase UbiE
MTQQSEDEKKYHGANPFKRVLVNKFFSAEKRLIKGLSIRAAHETGCGEGYNLVRLRKILAPGSPVSGSDINMEKLIRAGETCGNQIPLVRADVTQLPFASDAFDLVVATEVLEHLEDPESALEEIRRVSARYALLSVPLEPLWRAMNIAGGANIARLGNTPGHVQHYQAAAFSRLVRKFFRIVKTAYPPPWQMVLGEKIGD